VLNETARTLKNCMRAEDILCRYGGEEFVVLLPETGPDEAIKAAEKIHEKLRAMDLRYSHQDVGRVTLSIGISVFPDMDAPRTSL
jgi:diguanylate cyclase (GGDEF)-like protein